MSRNRTRIILKEAFLFICLPSLFGGSSRADEDSKYLDAGREFADNVLKYGRDTYGPKHTPLFVDGLNIHTHEPVKWIAPNGDRWILSNLASQQNLFRTLDGLTKITGDPKYRQAAMEAIEYAFANLRSPNGLLYWGHITAYDALGDTPCGDTSHESIKLHYPYYELMWRVDPDATRKLIEALWCAHVMDWSNLDFNRIGITTGDLEEPWSREYKGGPTFFKSKYGGGGFFNTGTSLVHAGTTLYRLSSQQQPLVWSKRLAKRYVETRHPNTGISYEAYNTRWSQLGDDLKEHFADQYTTYFPYLSFESQIHYYYPENTQAYAWMSLLLVGEMLGEDGREFTQWALEEFTAWGKASYRKKDNSFVPILTDGTNLEGYVWRYAPGTGSEGLVVKSCPADMPFFWAYSVAYRTTGDEFMWQMARDIALGNGFGDIGETPAHMPDLRAETTCSHVYGLLGFLQLYEKTSKPSFLQTAQRIGDNILAKQFHKGFFVSSNKHIYTRFDCFEPLALLHLDKVTRSTAISVPRVWPSVPLFVLPYRHKQEGNDRQIIYTLTESPEPPMSLQEAAAIGDINLASSLLEKGVGVDSWDDSLKKTALQRAAIGGHREVVELLLAKGARIDAHADWPGGTALDYAAEKGHKEIAELLIAKGADVNATRGYPAGNTPLHSAVIAGHKDIIELLLAKGSSVNAKNNDGLTPLHLVASQRPRRIPWWLNLITGRSTGSSQNIAQLLINNGADANARDNQGRTPRWWAETKGNKEVAELLRKHRAEE